MLELIDNNKYAMYRTIRYNPSLNVVLYSFGERLFSSMTPLYERNLQEEIYGLRCVVKFTLDEIMDMPVADRRLFIQLHNQRIERENSSLQDTTSAKESMNEVKDLVNKEKTKREEKNK
jgi:hypothetical protein